MSGYAINTCRGQTRAAKSRGKPLAILGLLLVAWTAGRVMLWEAPWPQLGSLTATALASDAASTMLADKDDRTTETAQASSTSVAQPWQGLAPPPPIGAMRVEGLDANAVPLASMMPSQPDFATMDGAAAAVGHQVIWMAAMSHLPVPVSVQQSFARANLPVQQPSDAVSTTDRWSADSWLYWRQNSNSALVSQTRAPTYGASQLGAVLNYRLAPSAARDPRAYVRAYRALVENGESELSVGLSARPLAELPLRAHAELRATQRSGDTGVELRPSAFVTSEIPPVDLPFKARAEFYAQAGYVGGDDATAFADGQLHVLRDVGQFDLAKISFGAAAWGGAQKGAERVDVGPSMRVDMTIGSVPARLSVDYRERVAGSAQPDSGAAVTLSTSF